MKHLITLAMAVVTLLGCPNDASRQGSKNSESAQRRQKVYDAMSQAQDKAEQALNKAEETYNRAMKSANEVKDQVVQEAGNVQQAAQELVANAKRATDVQDSMQRHADKVVSTVEQALGVGSPDSKAKDQGRDGSRGGAP